MQLKFSLKQVWTTLILFAIVVPVTILIIWYGQNSYHNQLDSALTIQLQANESLRDKIESEFNRLKTLLENKSDPLSLLLDKADHLNNLKDINTLLKVISKREQAIRETVITSKQGDIIAAIVPNIGITGERILSVEELDSVAKHWGYNKKYVSPDIVIPSIGKIYTGSPNKHDGFIGFNISLPIGAPVKAVLIAKIDIEKLWPPDITYGTGKHKTNNYILDSRGSLITKIPDSKYKPGDLMTHLSITRAALINEKWPTDDSYIGVINQPVFGTKTYIPHLHWTLISEVIYSNITQPIWSSLSKIIIITLIATVGFVWFVLYLANKTLKPIQNACEAIDHVAKGDYKFDLKPSGIVELDSMTSCFNNMVKARNNAEYSLSKREQHLKLYTEQAPMATIEWSTDFQVLNWNKAAEKMFGYSVDEVRGLDFVDIMLPKNSKVDVKQVWNDLMNESGGEISVNENLTKDGHTILCEWHNTPLLDDKGKVIGAASIIQDITKRKQEEEQINRSQKMDALGKLTGGIAHDYNNMLGVILGYSQLIEEKLINDKKLAKYIQHIIHATKRGVSLTEKLLSFTRKRNNNGKFININSLLMYAKEMLEKTLTARIKLSYDLTDNLWPVLLDSDELEDVIINLSINAMHAMDGHGHGHGHAQITIQTQNTFLNSADARSMQIESGDYVQLSLTDTGCGMDEISKQKIFDPFYSTKGEKGTGLGLSQVYGFVQRSKGAIAVNSKVNKGTKFELYFPRHNMPDDIKNETDEKTCTDLRGTETILVTDDEEAARLLASEILTNHGYHVICAEDGQQALDILKDKPVDLLFSDIIMPEMDGYRLAVCVQKMYPSVKIQLTSGFTDDRHLEHLNDRLHKNLLYKPYDSKSLLLNIQKLLRYE